MLALRTSAMPPLHNVRHLARLVLAWFVLSLGVAVVAPVFKAAGTQVVCTGMGTLQMPADADGGDSGEHRVRTLDCPMCAPMAAPPAVAHAVLAVVPLAPYILRSLPSPHRGGRFAIPPPARAPPEL